MNILSGILMISIGIALIILGKDYSWDDGLVLKIRALLGGFASIIAGFAFTFGDNFKDKMPIGFVLGLLLMLIGFLIQLNANYTIKKEDNESQFQISTLAFIIGILGAIIGIGSLSLT